jgi:hypothetical protein
LMNPASRSFRSSTPIARHRSSSKRHSRCCTA